MGSPSFGRSTSRPETKLSYVRRIELRDEAAGLDALIVIDHDLFPVSAGGTRMLADVDAREVARLARAMTWKFAVCGVRYAGAKAGIRFEKGDRDAVLSAYRRALMPFKDVFLTGPDMGTQPADFVTPDLEGMPLWAQSYEGLGMDDLATGHGVKAAAEAALGHLGRALEGATVAIEGFGKVGAGTARACARAGARVVAISTVHGLLADPAGLDVEHLLELRGRFGERFVENADPEARPREELFEQEVDVLVPGARPDSVTPEVAERVRCAVVSPGANIPYSPGAVEALHRRGIVAIPDFISNSGGVHLYESVEQDDEPVAALAKIERLIADTVTRTLAAADAAGVTPLEAALRDVRAYLAEETGAADDVLDELVAA
jgi:glutamate dehydrogenase (NAD(P)+)